MNEIISRWDALLAAEVTTIRREMSADELEAVSAQRGIALSADANAKAIAVARLKQREPKLHEAYVAAFNESGIGSRARNNRSF